MKKYLPTILTLGAGVLIGLYGPRVWAAIRG